MPRWLGGSQSGGNDNFTKSLLHLDNSLTDSAKGISSQPRTWTSHSTSFTILNKFGTHSLSTNTNQWIDTPDSADFTIGTNDFTVDFWARIGGVGDGTVRSYCGQMDAFGGDESFDITILNTNVVQIFLQGNGTNVSLAGSRQLLATENSGNPLFHHIAAVRRGGVLRLFIDGTQDGSDVSAILAIHDSASNFSIGRPGQLNGDYFIGQIDEFRLSVGIARWFTNFTPPTRAYLPT
jgi:hypothetical protein